MVKIGPKYWTSQDIEEDKVSNLPDHILHYILSFLDFKYAVLTSALSRRWRFLWVYSLDISLDNKSFDDHTCFKNFVLEVFKRRPYDSKIGKFCFSIRNKVDESLLNRVISYALSHNADHLIIKPECRRRRPQITCQRFYLTESFTKVTTLYLQHCLFSYDGGSSAECIDFFAGCPNLITLSLIDCGFEIYSEILKISGSRLLNLTLESVTITTCGMLEISAPKLAFLRYIAGCMDFSAINLPSLQQVEVDAFLQHASMDPKEIDAYYPNLFKLLRLLHNAQSLTLYPDIIEALTAAAEEGKLEQRIPPFRNLKSLKLKVESCDDALMVHEKVMTYLLNGSPCAETTIIQS